MTHPTDDELEALAIDLEEHAGWESEWQINITTKAASTIRKLKAERGAAVTVWQAAKVLLDASGDWWPSQEAKQAAISAYTRKNGKCRPVALTDAWHAALNALKEPDT